jgi:hypothetical protein
MKKLAFAFAALTALTLGACKDGNKAPEPTAKPGEPAKAEPAKAEPTKAEPAKAEGDSVGVAECDKFLAAYRACVDKMPEAARGPANDGLKQMVDAWKQTAAAGDAAKESLKTACQSAYDNSKQAMAQACPDVKWE